MNSPKISPDDPQLTAFALGELEGAEHAAIEAAVKNDPAAQTVVAQIRALGGDLSAALAKEPAPAASPGAAKQHETAAAAEPDPYPRRKIIRFPYFIIAGLAAACFVVMFVVGQRESVYKEKAVALAKVKSENNETALADKKHASAVSERLYQIALDPANADAVRVAAMPEPKAAGGMLAAEQASKVRAVPAAAVARGRVAEVDRPGAPPAIAAGKGLNTEAYAYSKDNDFLGAAGNPLSTFSIDVDTASYANVRRFLSAGQRPPADAVRIEELVNYFPYRYAPPKDTAPFAASMEVAAAPWNPQHRLVRIGLKGREVSAAQRPPVNLVFLLDVSGSMNEPNKLPLVQESIRLLVERLKPADRVAIAVYAGASGLALPSTEIAKKNEILAAIDSLSAGGSTNGAMGIQLAYDIAKANFIPGAANRVVLCTDGDFNVGVTSEGELTRLIEEKAKSGVFLTVLGFGMGNYKDATLEKLADKGNGNYGYIDTVAEAKKLLVEQLSGTLVTIAKDVKLQVEFNPARVQSYRLIGYENRLLNKEDFNNDKIDAGEIGAGHTVTALYEVVPVGADDAAAASVDALKYQAASGSVRAKGSDSPELLTLKIRYKVPAADVSQKLEFPLVDSGATFAGASQDFKFAAAVAGFGMILRESPHKGAATFDAVLGWAEDGTDTDAGGYRHEFIDLVKKAKACSG